MIAQLERQRSRLEGVSERARKQGQAAVRLREIDRRIDDLRASLW